MAKRGTKTATPRLRFPEFDGAWAPSSLDSHLEECGYKVSSPTSIPIYSSSRGGLTPQSNYYDGHILLNDGAYGVVPPDAFVYRHMSDDGKFAFNINETGDEIAVSKEYPVFRTVDLDANFLRALLNNSPAFKEFALSQKAGGTRTRLYFSKLREWKTVLPTLAEQQKIADCLTSLDEVIAAQGRKVEALKTHKRGLMQQLFPRAGETRPRLRFPEFRDAPEWELGTLGDVCEVLNNRRVPISSSDRRPGSFPYYGASGVVDFVDHFIFDERLLLVGEDGAKWGAFEETAFIAEGKYWVNNHAHVLKPVNVIDTLLASYLTMLDLASYVTGHAPPKLTLGKLKSIAIVYPESLSEQQRIADCLASLDTGITAEAAHLAALKTHKQGLMQQLFPAPEATGA